MSASTGPRLYHLRGSIAIPATNYGNGNIVGVGGVLNYRAPRRVPVRIVSGTITAPATAPDSVLRLHLFGRPLATAEVPADNTAIGAAFAASLADAYAGAVAFQALSDVGAFKFAHTELRAQEQVYVPTFEQSGTENESLEDPQIGVLVAVGSNARNWPAATIRVALIGEAQ